MNAAAEMQRELQAEKSRDAALIVSGVLEWFMTGTDENIDPVRRQAMIDRLIAGGEKYAKDNPDYSREPF